MAPRQTGLMGGQDGPPHLSPPNAPAPSAPFRDRTWDDPLAPAVPHGQEACDPLPKGPPPEGSNASHPAGAPPNTP